MLYIGGVRTFQGDILSQTIDISGNLENDTFSVHGLNKNFTKLIPKDPQTADAQTGDTGGFNLMDALYMGWGVIAFVLNIITAPVGIFLSVPNLPPIITFLFGLPIGVLFIIAIIYFIRSGK